MTSTSTATASHKVFLADVARFDKAFREADAIRTGFDGVESFTYIDESKVSPDLVRAYGRFMRYGYANGLVR